MMMFGQGSAILSATQRTCLCVLAIGPLILGAFGCDSFESSATPTSVVSCQVAASMPAQSLAAAGGRGSLDVSALPECAWNVTPSAGWITGVTPASGQGSHQVTFVAAGNPTTQMRQGEILVNSVRLIVRQEAAPPPPPPPPPAPTPPPAPPPPAPTCSYSIKPDEIKVGRNGATGRTTDVTTAAGCRWTAVSNATWITATSGTSGTGSGRVTFNVAANGTHEKRTGTMTIAGQTLRVEQDK
jgi:hypothetical protein